MRGHLDTKVALIVIIIAIVIFLLLKIFGKV